jgi:hypothetical protein
MNRGVAANTDHATERLWGTAEITGNPPRLPGLAPEQPESAWVIVTEKLRSCGAANRDHRNQRNGACSPGAVHIDCDDGRAGSRDRK